MAIAIRTERPRLNVALPASVTRLLPRVGVVAFTLALAYLVLMPLYRLQELAFEDGDMHKGEKPNIVAAAYTNSFGKPDKTALYDIDATIGALVHQTKPNDGALKAIGKLGIDKAKSYAFDIHTTADGKNTAWLVADGTLYTVALETGKATMVGQIAGNKGTIRDIAVLAR